MRPLRADSSHRMQGGDEFMDQRMAQLEDALQKVLEAYHSHRTDLLKQKYEIARSKIGTRESNDVLMAISRNQAERMREVNARIAAILELGDSVEADNALHEIRSYSTEFNARQELDQAVNELRRQ